MNAEEPAPGTPESDTPPWLPAWAGTIIHIAALCLAATPLMDERGLSSDALALGVTPLQLYDGFVIHGWSLTLLQDECFMLLCLIAPALAAGLLDGRLRTYGTLVASGCVWSFVALVIHRQGAHDVSADGLGIAITLMLAVANALLMYPILIGVVFLLGVLVRSLWKVNHTP